MAKKNSNSTAPPATTRRRGTRSPGQPAAAPVDIASVTPTEPIDTAADRESHAGRANQPDYDEIARAAYQRYLSRGGSDGRDFDDWIEAERELAARNER